VLETQKDLRPYSKQVTLQRKKAKAA
jgi:hypothetical protein